MNKAQRVGKASVSREVGQTSTIFPLGNQIPLVTKRPLTLTMKIKWKNKEGLGKMSIQIWKIGKEKQERSKRKKEEFPLGSPLLHIGKQL